MPSLKAIRKRISSVKSTQKITRAMKMVAGARLARAQTRITALRPYALKTEELLAAVASDQQIGQPGDGAHTTAEEAEQRAADHPLLVVRPEQRVLYLVLTSDRGLCGAFNTNISKTAERAWRSRVTDGQEVSIYTVGRKGRDYLKRRGAPITHEFTGVWEKLDMQSARLMSKTVLTPFLKGEVDAIYVVYNEFKSAMTQKVTMQKLLPIPAVRSDASKGSEGGAGGGTASGGGSGSGGASGGGDGLRDGQGAGPTEYIFEPNKGALLEQLVPMYVETTLLRALFESMASELGARMTAMDSATKNAKEMISALTLVYNRARQAAITKELMEIIGGAEALKE